MRSALDRTDMGEHMRQQPSRLRVAASLGCLVMGMFAVIVGSANAGAAGNNHVVRAALKPGKITHIFVIEFENEGYNTTFGPGSPATYLNGTLRPEGELLQNYYA